MLLSMSMDIMGMPFEWAEFVPSTQIIEVPVAAQRLLDFGK